MRRTPQTRLHKIDSSAGKVVRRLGSIDEPFQVRVGAYSAAGIRTEMFGVAVE
jgi:hypothetical protein